MSRPTTPSRPPRSERRLTLDSITSSSSTPSPSNSNVENTPPPLPTFSTASSSSSPCSTENDQPKTPTTPKTPTPRLSNRKSTSSIKRKPVPLTPEDLSLDLSQLPSRRSGETDFNDSPLTLSTAHYHGVSDNQPPRYILPVDLPSQSQASPIEYQTQVAFEAGPSTSSSSPTNIDFSASRPPSYAVDHAQPQVQGQVQSNTSSSTSRHEELYFDPTAGLGGNGGTSTFTLPSTDELPCYAEETQTEPKTLARALWKWGFLCPFLWIIGMCILWIPLKPVVEESDPEKAQKLEEMIVILRQTEIKYAKRCAYGCLGFSLLLAVIIVVAILLSKFL